MLLLNLPPQFVNNASYYSRKKEWLATNRVLETDQNAKGIYAKLLSYSL
jgi:hypothetical protein